MVLSGVALERIIQILTEIWTEIVGGLVGTAILGGLALLLRKVGPERLQQWANKLRRLAWPFLAFVFLATALMVAILRPPPSPIVVALGTILVLVLASFILLRFGPAKIRRLWAIIRAHAWSILTGLFFLSTVALLTIGIIWPPPPPPPPPQTRITFVVDLADEEMMVMRDILDELEPELGAKVFLMGVDSSRYVSRLDKMVASDNMKWDLIALDNNLIGVLAEKPLVEELSRYAEYDTFIPSTLLPSLRPLCKYDGKWYFAPFRPNVKIAFYNEPKFAQYGLTPPRTWDELSEVARVFHEKEGVGRVAIQGYPGPCTAVTVFEFVTAAGGDPLTLDDEGSIEAFTRLQELEPYLAEEYTETRFDTANEFLITDEVYLVRNWTYGIKVVVEDAGKEEIKPSSGWKGPKREVHVLGGDVLAIPKGAPHPEESIKLMELLIGEESQQKMLSRLRWLPVRFDAYYGIPSEMAPYFRAINEALTFAELRPPTPQWTLVEEVLDWAFREIVQEGRDIDEVLKEASAALKEIPSDFMSYQVKPGDTLEALARRYNTTITTLAAANGITTTTSVYPKQILLVPEQ